jgi:heptosyltransferase-2
MKQAPKCKRFNGYKPCFPDHNCWDDGCKENEPIGTKILIINLDAMGDVLMTTAQLASLKKEYPASSIYWITLPNAAALLKHNHFLEQVFTFSFESILILEHMNFDIVLNVDKSQRSAALLNKINAKEKRGFGLNEDGKIVPVNEGALYNYRLGMDDNLKFNVNTKFGQQYLAETFEIPYERNEYVLNLTDEEIAFTEAYKNSAGIQKDDFVVGFNTGCSLLFPNKKMTVGQHITLIERLLAKDKYKIILLGGPEDTERNAQIAEPFGDKIINTPTTGGLRKGICYENIADLIITGDSFGMHLAIALRKYVIAWFGLSCQQEIDLYDRGIKLWPEDLSCSPCWKKNCPYNLECIDMIDLDTIIEEVENYYKQRRD